MTDENKKIIAECMEACVQEMMNVKALPVNWREIVEKQKQKDKRYSEWKEKHGWKDHRVGTCKLCSSKVKPDIVMEFNPSYGPMIIGPGSRNQFRRVHKGFYCTNEECGLIYKYPAAPVTIVDENPWVEEEE